MRVSWCNGSISSKDNSLNTSIIRPCKSPPNHICWNERVRHIHMLSSIFRFHNIALTISHRYHGESDAIIYYNYADSFKMHGQMQGRGMTSQYGLVL